MAELLSSKVIIVEESPRLRTIPTASTAVAAMAGITEKGPIRVPTLITSFDEYVNIYGGYIAASTFTAQVEQFFNNGGTQVWISRITHYTDITNNATKDSVKAAVTIDTATGNTQGTVLGTVAENFDLEPGDTLDVAVDGAGAVTATFTATAAARTSLAETFALNNNDTLLVAIDGGSTQTITFLTAEFSNIALATALEVAAVINAKSVGLSATVAGGMVTITSDRRGSGSGVNVTGGTGNAALGFTTGNIAGTGNVSNIDAVTAAEVKTVVEAAVAGVTVSAVLGAVQIVTDTVGSTGDVQVDAASTADDELGLDNALHAGTDAGVANALTVQGKYDGTYANGPTTTQVVIGASTSGAADEFNLSVVYKGVTVEVWPNLVNDNVSSNDVTAVLNAASGSKYIEGVFVASGRPVNGTYNPTGGDDGLTSLNDTDYVGSDAGDTGFHAFNNVLGIRIIAAPDRDSGTVQEALVDYAEVTREGSMFAVVTLPLALTATQAITHVETTFSLLNRSEFGAVYWPGLNVLNPSTSAFGSGSTITIPPTCSVMGNYARIDGLRPGGVYDEPAGVERGRLSGVVSLETDEALNERKRDLLYPKRINPISTFPGAPIFVDGVRVLKGQFNFPTVAQRRGVIFIEQSIKDGMQVYRYRANNEETQQEVERTIGAFLLQQFRARAFRGSTPANSYFVQADETVNPPTEVDAGRLNVRIGVATQRPAEFIVLRFSQDLRDVEAEVAAAGA
jgi:phage tail sheath protein FI